jgi:phage baseplate assembly protein W
MIIENIYLDLTTNLIIHPIKGDIILLKDEIAVKRSIINLMFTQPYERFFSPNIGAGLTGYLFENISQDTEYIIREKIIEVISNFEPRANIINVSVKAIPDENLYNAKIIFSVLNNINPLTLEVILRRVR